MKQKINQIKYNSKTRINNNHSCSAGSSCTSLDRLPFNPGPSLHAGPPVQPQDPTEFNSRPFTWTTRPRIYLFTSKRAREERHSSPPPSPTKTCVSGPSSTSPCSLVSRLLTKPLKKQGKRKSQFLLIYSPLLSHSSPTTSLIHQITILHLPYSQSHIPPFPSSSPSSFRYIII